MSAFPPDGRVPLREKLSYGLADFGNCLYWQFFKYYLLYFYTDIFKIAPKEHAAAVAGTMFLVVRLWDAVFDVVVGVVADRTTSRWGKFRPYLLFGAVPFGLAGIICFTTPSFDATGKIIYAYVTYTFLMMVYSSVAIPQNSLLGVITPNPVERTSLSRYKFVFAFSAGLVVQFFTPRLVNWFGGGSAAHGYQMALVCYAIVAAVLFIQCFLIVRERVSPPAGQKTRLVDDARDLLGNRPWLVLFAVTMATILSYALRTGTLIHYYKYYVGAHDMNTIFWGVRHFTYEELFSWSLVLGSVLTIAATAMLPYAARYVGKKMLYAILMGISNVAVLAYYFLSPDQIGWIVGLQLFVSMAQGPTSAILWAMYADCADYSEWKNGRRATGLVFSAAVMSQKFGWSLGGAIPGWLLAYVGYVADTQLSAQALHGLLLTVSILPSIAGFLATGCTLFYSLDERRVAQIGEELAKRREFEAVR